MEAVFQRCDLERGKAIMMTIIRNVLSLVGLILVVGALFWFVLELITDDPCGLWNVI